MKKAALFLGSLAFVISLVGLGISMAVATRAHHLAKQVLGEPCSTRQNLCIELDEADGGVVARFNDFRFDGKQCLYYRVLAPDAWQHYCGAGYKLNWIGPETQKL